jgi:hypothetical protein
VTCPVGIHVKSVADALEGQPADVFWKKFAREVTK